MNLNMFRLPAWEDTRTDAELDKDGALTTYHVLAEQCGPSMTYFRRFGVYASYDAAMARATALAARRPDQNILGYRNVTVETHRGGARVDVREVTKPVRALFG